MRMLEINDWLIISNIIYKIHAIDNFDEMRQELLIQLKLLIDYDSADFVLVTNEEGNLVDSAVTYNYDISLSEKFRNVEPQTWLFYVAIYSTPSYPACFAQYSAFDRSFTP